MKPMLISGQICVESTLQIDSFPLHYSPVLYPFFGIKTSIAGVGLNMGKALQALGNSPCLMSITGKDMEGETILQHLQEEGFDTGTVLPIIDETPQSIIIYDKEGKRQIHCDLKDIQETGYPPQLFITVLKQCSLAVLCNINFSRPFLKIARELNIPIATDLHDLSSVYDEYNGDFLKYGDIIFLSDEKVPPDKEQFIWDLAHEYDLAIIVMGLGAFGSLLYVKEEQRITHYKAVRTRQIINTIGAGDALFSCFLHYYIRNTGPHEALKRATLFASWKIGATGAAQGFAGEKKLEELYKEYHSQF